MEYRGFHTAQDPCAVLERTMQFATSFYRIIIDRPFGAHLHVSRWGLSPAVTVNDAPSA